MQLYLCAIREGHRLLEVCPTDGHIMAIGEDVLAISLSDTRLADTTVTEEDDLSFHYFSRLLSADCIGVLHPRWPLPLFHLQWVPNFLLFLAAAPRATPPASLVWLRCFH